MFFSLSLFASIKACSSKVLASGLSSLIIFNDDGQTRGCADERFSNAAHAPCLCFRATTYGIRLHKHRRHVLRDFSTYMNHNNYAQDKAVRKLKNSKRDRATKISTKMK